MAQHLLARSTPFAEGVDARHISAFLDRLEERSIECHSVMIVRHGHVIAEGWWAPYSADRPHLLYSLTKSFTSIAVGFAVTDGLLALDDRVVDVLPDHVPAHMVAQAAQLTVHHLLTMTAGHREDSLAEAWALEPTDLVKGFLRVPTTQPVGTHHAYDNPTTFVLARMVERVTGRTVPEILDDRLFGPMGVRQTEWDRVASGATFGFHGLHLTTEAVAAFGELLLRNDGHLIPRGWVELATRRQVATVGDHTPDWLQGYGYQFWMSRHGYRGDGAFGQLCLVLPEHDLVVVTTAATTDMQGLLDAVWDCVLPGIENPGNAGRPEDDRALEGRLRQLALPFVDGTPGERRLRLDTVDIEVGYRTWRESSPLGRPVVACGAWQGDKFVADVYVITTPHRLRVVVDKTGTVATWNIEPLVGPDLLRQLRSPLMTRPDVS